MSLHRLSLRLAERILLDAGLTPATPLTLEALWTRVVYELRLAGKLGRFSAIADKPGLPGALARSIEEMRLAAVEPQALAPDLAAAAAAFERILIKSALADRAAILRGAIAECSKAPHPLIRLPTLFLDIEVHCALECELIQTLATLAPDVLATVPTGDQRTVEDLSRALGTAPIFEQPQADEPVARLQRNVFEEDEPASKETAEQVTIFSAPSEMRECVEIARLVHAEAERGTPFDRMAVLLRSPAHYRTSIIEALRRAGIPAYYAREARKPDPAGRAFLSLLACAEESLSASRFAEYISLGEVPDATADGEPPQAASSGERWTAGDPDEAEGIRERPDVREEAEPSGQDPEAPRALEGLRTPRRWEKLLVDAAVIGGLNRWERRLDGLEARLTDRCSDPTATEVELAAISRNLSNLRAIRSFALPLLDVLAGFSQAATWGVWLDQLSSLASRALRHPTRVLGVLSELLPMGPVGPVTLQEVRRVLAPRLVDLVSPRPRRRFGHLFVGSADAARGLSFDVVFTPGLAERIFPQRVHGDPLCTDAERAAISPHLERDSQRATAERLHLRIAIGAASKRLVFSYPRLDYRETRPRVPSFYGLEVVRAAEGRLLRYEELRRRAELSVEARIGWPAPTDPSKAIDFAERDLSVLEPMFRPGMAPNRGAARYLIEVNPFLARALRAHYARLQPHWSFADGLVKPSTAALAALSANRPTVRSFSPTVLQHFAECPYRFFLSAIVRLSPREEPEPIEELDPLQRGSLMHEVLYEVMKSLRDDGALPLNGSLLDVALAQVDDKLRTVSERYRDLYAPAIERVWTDSIDHIRADLREAIRQMAAIGADWTPWKFELAFGLAGTLKRGQEDADSRAEPVDLGIGIKLRGSIDLVERSPAGTLRATDYKTGKAVVEPDTRVGGGKTLQPVLYALALEEIFPGSAVAGGRLSYCTMRGGFSEVFVPLDDHTRNAAREAVGIVMNALETGFFPAAPQEKACARCDLNAVCGLNEEARTARKVKKDLLPLMRLREMK